jgi:hypothetical protein
LDAIKAMETHPEAHPESKFAYIRHTRHNDFSDFGLAFTQVMLYAKQTGPAIPAETHSVHDELTMEFISKYIEIPVKHERDPNIDMDGRVVFGEAAFADLYEVMPKH